jgi:hypothetical protein
MTKMSILLPALAAALAVCMLLPAPARAQITLWFYDRDEVEYDFTDDDRDKLEDGFNTAECEAGAGMTLRYEYTGSTGSTKFDLWVGASCDVKENRDEDKCYNPSEYNGQYIEDQAEVEIHPAWVVDSMSATPTCTEDEGLGKVWMFIFNEDSEETIKWQAFLEVGYDTVAPPAPIDVAAEYGEERATVSWDVANENSEDWDHFIVLCYPTSGTQPPPEDASSDEETAEDVPAEEAAEDVPAEEDESADAASDDDAAETGDDTAEEDAAPDTAPDTATDTTTDATEGEGCPSGGFSPAGEFDSAYACSPYLGQSTRSYSVTGLTNGTAYKFAVVAFDLYRNPSPISPTACATPQPVDDFWDHYKKSGGGAKEGFCFVATAAYGSPLHPFVGTLRQFRDEVLMKFSAGRSFVDLYYRHGPAAARVIERSAPLKTLARVALLPAVAGAWVTVLLLHNPWLALLAVGLFLAAAGVRSRRRVFPGLLGILVAASLAAGSPALAKDKNKDENAKYKAQLTKHHYEGSPQHFAAELKFGPYFPDIDKEFDGAERPFHDVFGSSSAVIGLFEFDYQFLRPPGISLGIGGQIGGFRFEGKALDPDTGERSGEDTTFAAIPMNLDLVIRVDALLRYTVVPLVPYIKGGLSYYVWWTKNESGVSSIEGEQGRGGTFGWNLQTGLMLCLDPFEPRAARTFDNEVGVNNSYLFAEFFLAQIDNFGTGNALNLSDMTWLVGLALEF